ncbi:MAG: tRNA methyltransferase [Deltaproteobacteria bacterium]|nr:tRNA methyltransferase [Deltaproteobacteria bacterium]
MRALRGTELKRFMRGQERPKLDLVLVLEDVEDPVNVGSVFRIADAADAKLVLSGITPAPPHKLIEKIGRGKDRRVPWSTTDDLVAKLGELRSEGHTIFALELTDASVIYSEVEYPSKTVIVVGHEDHGVTKKTLAAVDRAIYIPMFGKGASLNVHVALSVATFEVIRRRTAMELARGANYASVS